MKPLTSNLIFLVIAGALVISIGSLTHITSQKTETKQNEIVGTSTQTIQKTNIEDDDVDDNPPSQTVKPVTQNPPSSVVPPVNTPKPYTAGDVALHNNQSSCWTIVNGNVYDVTSYINSHPGGQRAITSICGRDGSSAFDNQHGGDSKPERILQSFLLSPLK